MKQVFTILIILLIGCQRSTSTKVDAKIFVPEPDESYILFLNYELISMEDGPQAEFINQIITTGKIKNLSRQNPDHLPKLVIEMLGSDRQQLEEIPCLYPLLQEVEYADDEGYLKRKTIELESAELAIRVQLHPETKEIVLWFIDKSNVKKELNRKPI